MCSAFEMYLELPIIKNPNSQMLKLSLDLEVLCYRSTKGLLFVYMLACCGMMLAFFLVISCSH